MTVRYRLPLFSQTISLPNGVRKEAAADGWFYPRDATEAALLQQIGCTSDDTVSLPDDSPAMIRYDSQGNPYLVDGGGNRSPIVGLPNNSRYAGYELSAFYSRPATDYQVVGAGSTIAVDTSVTRSGSHTLKVTCNRGSATTTDVNVLHTWNNFVSFAGRIGFWIFVPDYTLLTAIIVKVSHGGTGYANGAFQTYAFSDTDKSYNGWHFVGFDKAEFGGSYGTPDWTTYIGAAKLTITQSSATAAPLYIDSMVAGWRSKAKILVTADDGEDSFFSLGLPILDSLGLRASMCIIGPLVDSGPTWVTSAQLASAYANGHDLCVHGATAMSGLADDAARRADIALNKAFLESRGYARGNDFYVWPNGIYALSAGDATLIQILQDQGFKAARGTTTPRFYKHGPGTTGTKWLMPVIGPTASDTVAAISTLIDSAITYGATCFLMYHKLQTSGATGSTERNVSDFMRDMESLAAKRDAGLCDVIGVSQFTNAL